MAQLFGHGINPLSRVSLVALVVLAGVALWLCYVLVQAPWTSYVAVARVQPVPFSHKHHVSGLGIDCRYCHTSVEDAAFAGIPPTKTCMTCHSQIWKNAAILEPVRQSWATGQTLHWNRVHDLPMYVFFNHSIHIHKGIGCDECHGDIQNMPLTWKAKTMQMQFCLHCHRHPERYIRPVSEVFNYDYKPPEDQDALGLKLVDEYKIQKGRLDNCYICHR